MDNDTILQWARKIVSGEVTPQEFQRQWSGSTIGSSPIPSSPIPSSDANVDLDRAERCGFPEVVFGQGKSVDSLHRIFHALLQANQPVLATRVNADVATELTKSFPLARYNSLARTIRIGTENDSPREGTDAGEDEANSAKLRPSVAIVTAGTTDRPVAEEARETVEWMGIPTRMLQDVGVAGPHRLLSHIDSLRESSAIVVAAGMEGALPSVVGGYVSVPVIAVPTSVGYGSAFGGITALLGMLNSCAANVAVVNIDAGFKAGYLAGLIAKRSQD